MKEINTPENKESIIKGVVIKAIGGFYYVAKDDLVYECRARGRFRLDGQNPLPGDHVEFRIESGKTKGGYVEEIFDRKNVMQRPAVANIDQICLVISMDKPRPDLLLVDKLLINAHRENVGAVLVMNKSDVKNKGVLDMLEKDYDHLEMKIFKLSALVPETLVDLRKNLIGKISCFTGQSAVGKSSLLNAMSKDFNIETGDMSKKTGRGRHTTRAIELRMLEGDNDSYVMDTPGFTMLEVSDMQPQELQLHYPDFAKYISKCKFDDCVHVDEPGCAVKDAVKKGELPNGRYQRYLAILEEIKELKDKKYK